MLNQQQRLLERTERVLLAVQLEQIRRKGENCTGSEQKGSDQFLIVVKDYTAKPFLERY